MRAEQIPVGKYGKDHYKNNTDVEVGRQKNLFKPELLRDPLGSQQVACRIMKRTGYKEIDNEYQSIRNQKR